MPEWIKCSDQMPQPGRFVLLWLMDRTYWAGRATALMKYATHWIYLPEPPAN